MLEKDDGGFVYIAQITPVLFKVGKTRTPRQRIYGLRTQTRTKTARMVHYLRTSNMAVAERYLIERFRKLGIPEPPQGSEWFFLGSDQVRWFCSLIQIEPDLLCDIQRHGHVATFCHCFLPPIQHLERRRVRVTVS